MKKFSQYINSNEDCNCDQSVDEEVGTFMKGALGTIGKGLMSGAAKVIAGSGASAIVQGGTAAVEKRKQGAEMLDNAVIQCSARVTSLEKELLRRKGKPDEATVEEQLKETKAECAKIKAASNERAAAKQLAAMRKEKADLLRRTP